MDHFTKYYSYNQVIEEHDVLIMSQQEYLTNKDNLDNPKVIVCVKREGGPKEPKVPKWFQSYKKEADARFEKIEAQLNEPKMPQWFKQWSENVYEKRQPKWFTTWCKEKFDPLVQDVENIKDILARNNIH